MDTLLKALKYCYPFIIDSITRHASLTRFFKRHWFMLFIIILNLVTTSYLYASIEQNFSFLDRVKSLKADIVKLEADKENLELKNGRLLGLLKGDIDDICFTHIFGKSKAPAQGQSPPAGENDTEEPP